ncbi:MAG: MFS transporter, partial [Ktedonobacteraceae bacterium]
FDLLGFILAGLGLALVMYAVTEGPNLGWVPAIYGSLLAGLLLLSLFVIAELRMKTPMLNLRLYQDRLFRTATLVFLFAIASFIGLLFVLPLYLQEARGISPLISGLTTFPEALGLMASAQIVGRIYSRVGPRRLVVVGQIGVTVMLCLLLLVNLTTNLWLIRILTFFAGVAIAYTLIPIQAAAFANISAAATGKASALYNAQRQIGSALGVAMVGSVLKLVGPVSHNASGVAQPNLAAYHASFLTSAIIALLGACIALFIHNSDAAATMQRKQRSQDSAEKSDAIASCMALLAFVILLLIALRRKNDAT